MFLKLRILFTILSAICLALILPATAFLGWQYLGIFGGGALLFFLAMLLCKQKQEESETLEKSDGPDFLSPDEKDGKEE